MRYYILYGKKNTTKYSFSDEKAKNYGIIGIERKAEAGKDEK